MFIFGHILLHKLYINVIISSYITNKCEVTYLRLERSEWRKSHYSSRAKPELNNDLFLTRA